MSAPFLLLLFELDPQHSVRHPTSACMAGNHFIRQQHVFIATLFNTHFYQRKDILTAASN